MQRFCLQLQERKKDVQQNNEERQKGKKLQTSKLKSVAHLCLFFFCWLLTARGVMDQTDKVFTIPISFSVSVNSSRAQQLIPPCTVCSQGHKLQSPFQQRQSSLWPKLSPTLKPSWTLTSLSHPPKCHQPTLTGRRARPSPSATCRSQEWRVPRVWPTSRGTWGGRMVRWVSGCALTFAGICLENLSGFCSVFKG